MEVLLNSSQLIPWHVESVTRIYKAGLSLLFRQSRNVEICHLTRYGYPDPWAVVMMLDLLANWMSQTELQMLMVTLMLSVA